MIEHGTILVYRNDELVNNIPNEIRPAVITINAGSEIAIILTEEDDTGFFTSPIIMFTRNSENPSEYIFSVLPGAKINAYVIDENPEIGQLPANQVIVVDEDTGTQTFMNRRFNTSFPNCSNQGGDDDKDGLCDSWELGTELRVRGYMTNPIGEYVFACTSDNPCDDTQPDIFIAIDYMKGHRPNDLVIQQITDAFKNEGIRAHIQVDDADQVEILHKSCTTFPGSNFGASKGFDQIKAKFLGTNEEEAIFGGESNSNWLNYGWHQKRAVVHYVLFVHNICGSAGSSGSAEFWGNDAIISLGSFDGKIGNIDQQSGTLMHEIGHNLKLDHGGFESKNCKPLYLSVMNYAYQFEDLVENRALGYSKANIQLLDWAGVPTDLNEQSVYEVFDITGTQPPQQFTYGPIPPLPLPWTGNLDVDWDNDGVIRQDSITLTGLDNMKDLSGNIICQDTTSDILKGFIDSSIINLDSRGTSNYMDGRINGGTVEEDSACPSPRQINEARMNGMLSANDQQRVCAGGSGYTTTQKTLLKYELFLNELKKSPSGSNNQNSNINSTIKEFENALEEGKISTINTELQKIRGMYHVNSYVKSAVDSILKKPNPLLFKNDKEITVKNVLNMRLSRIDSLEQFIGNLQNDDFKNNNKNAAITHYQAEFNEIRESIINGDMRNAISKLIQVQDTYENFIEDADAKMKIYQGTKEILKSYSKSINDPTVVPNNPMSLPNGLNKVSMLAGSGSPGCELNDQCFAPNPIKISVDEDVTWLNYDVVVHTVTSGNPASGGSDGVFDSGLITTGKSYTYKFEETGKFSYFCTVHPWMTGIVVVE
ncbi:plastocyanin/azurin family copper-binding protein [Candidatus Nitrosotenuis cloacae]|uniref:plastocyanin/azurin family copper-binding protein n=1 Tax=Candidatus Nitrosotenuis cloacae TaxID=1603555 RepID=UPI00227E1560|nr:plastocyanin/azurin family copper-binding protein [Candidatus Nitrosotenuis cloacae]